MAGRTKTAEEFPVADTDTARITLEAQIAERRQVISEIETALREHRTALARLEESRKALGRRPKRRKQAARTPLQRAGRGNVQKALDFLQSNGATPKAAITASLGINDGTVTYALKHLEDTGRVRQTGERVRGSNVYEYVPLRRGVTRPGDR